MQGQGKLKLIERKAPVMGWWGSGGGVIKEDRQQADAARFSAF